MKCKNLINSDCDGSRLRDFLHSLPYREMRPMRAKIAEACGVEERTVMKWAIPSTFRHAFSPLQRAAINKVAGSQIF